MQSPWEKLPSIRVADAGYLLAGLEPERKWQFAPPLVRNFYNLIRDKLGAVTLATMPDERMEITQAEFQELKAEFGVSVPSMATTPPAKAPQKLAPEMPDPERRLVLLRELGGGSKYVRNDWKFTGMAALVAKEKEDGRSRCDEKTIRADLKLAAQDELEAKRAGFATGLGKL